MEGPANACGPACGPRREPPAFARAAYPPEILSRLAGAWSALRSDERRSVQGAALVAADLAELGAPPAIMGAAARVIEDEIRHVEVCTRVLDALDASALGTPLPGRPLRATAGTTTEARCAQALIAGFAVGEPMSAACFAAARRSAREPLMRWALTELLRDEARHGPFGVRAGAWVIRGWSVADRRSLWPACVEEMQRFERAIGGPPAADAGLDQVNGPLAALGLLGVGPLCAAAIASIPRLVLPPLETLGVVPGRAPGNGRPAIP